MERENVVDALPLHLNYSIEEKLKGLAQVKAMLEVAETNEWIKEGELVATSNVLHKLQCKFREEDMTEKAKGQVQKLLDDFFSQSQQN